MNPTSPTAQSVADERRLGQLGAQHLASILNNPLEVNDASWDPWAIAGQLTGALGVALGLYADESHDAAPPMPPGSREVTMEDFEGYLRRVQGTYPRFVASREAAIAQQTSRSANPTTALTGERQQVATASGAPTQGVALAQAMQQVPVMFFTRDYDFGHSDTFNAVTGGQELQASSSLMLQEKLSHYTDIVELHLQKEISARSDSFFETIGVLQELSASIAQTCHKMKSLRYFIHSLDQRLMATAVRVSGLHVRRQNLLALLQLLCRVESVAQCVSDLQLLLEASDYAGALDVLEDTRRVLEGEEIGRLHCFRHVGPHLDAAAGMLERLMTNEFVRIARVARPPGVLPASALEAFRERMEPCVSSYPPAMEALLAAVSRLHSAAGGVGGRAGKGAIAAAAAAAAAAAVAAAGGGGDAAAAAGGGPRGASLGDPDNLSLDQLVEHLRPITLGLLRMGRMPTALRACRDAVLVDIRDAVKTALSVLLPVLVALPSEDGPAPDPQVAAAAAGGDGAPLTELVRGLPVGQFLALQAATAGWLMLILERMVLAHKALCEITNAVRVDDPTACSPRWGIAQPSPTQRAADKLAGTEFDRGLAASGKAASGAVASSSSAAPGSVASQVAAALATTAAKEDALRESVEVLAAICDKAQERWSKMLIVRTAVHSRLRVSEFAQVAHAAAGFAEAVERMGPRKCLSLRSVLATQSKALLGSLHSASLNKLNGLLDREQWTREDVPREIQVIADKMIAAGQAAEQPGSPDPFAAGLAAQSRGSGDVAGMPSQPGLLVDGTSYNVVQTALLLVRMVGEYLDTAAAIPDFSGEVVHRLVEILKAYNTRSCQLLLGAAAIQVAGLKNITAKHLALASSSLGAVLALLPHARAALGRWLPERRAALLLGDVDRLLTDLRVHRDEIHAKLLAIMRERITGEIKRVPALAAEWAKLPEPAANAPMPQPSDFPGTFGAQLATLQRVLSPLLTPAETAAIFDRLTVLSGRQLVDVYTKAEAAVKPGQGGSLRRHLLVDGRAAAAALRSLQARGDGAVAAVQQEGGAAGGFEEYLANLEQRVAGKGGRPPPPPPSFSPPRAEAAHPLAGYVSAQQMSASDLTQVATVAAAEEAGGRPGGEGENGWDGSGEASASGDDGGGAQGASTPGGGSGGGRRSESGLSAAPSPGAGAGLLESPAAASDAGDTRGGWGGGVVAADDGGAAKQSPAAQQQPAADGFTAISLD